MDEVVKSLASMGGLGILAAALLYLHINALKSFREELAEERKGFLERNKAVVDALGRQTEILSQRLDSLAETFREIERRHYSGK